jgi:RHS repeat-associated protein
MLNTLMNINEDWMNFAYMDNPTLYGSGNAIQHLHYLPFGEDWVDQRNSSWNAPFTFSGKEKDVETGYSYFGARYYDSGLSIWLSVDPMSDKYPSMSPYNYCANNPVILVDPDGMDPDPLANIIKKGKSSSQTFNSLMNKAGVNESNMHEIITFGIESNSNPYTRLIDIDRNANLDNQILGLTHELTNRINSKKLAENMTKVRLGKITPEQYAENAIKIEAKGIVNQIIVAAEGDFVFEGPGSDRMNELKTQYQNGDITKRQLKKTIKNELNTTVNKWGNKAKDSYRKEGESYRKAQLEREKGL